MDPSETNSRGPVLPFGLPEDWVFERDLPCPQCRYNLRMLHMPRCPECGTVFRWQALLHVGCPRCGQSLREIDQAVCPQCTLPLAWERLLNEAPLGKRELYEYSDRPFRTATRTWLAVLLPRRFWKDIPIELPPAIDRLLRLRRIATVVCAAGLLLLLSTAVFTHRMGAWLTTCAVAFGLPRLTVHMLARFTPTLARFKVRREQLLRCQAYASLGGGWIGLLFIAAAAWGHVRVALSPGLWWWWRGMAYFDLFSFVELCWAMVRVPWRWWGYEELIVITIGLLFLWLGLVWWWRFLYVCLRHYLRLDLISAVALLLATQVIAVLALMLLLTFGLLFTRDGQRLLAGT